MSRYEFSNVGNDCSVEVSTETVSTRRGDARDCIVLTIKYADGSQETMQIHLSYENAVRLAATLQWAVDDKWGSP